jgi:hypothetical protein
MIERDASFSLDDALDLAETEYRGDFIDYWGVEASTCPDWLTEDEWLECRRLYGLAQKMANIGTTLLRRKGVGQGQLSEAAWIHQEAKTFQGQVESVLERIEDVQLRSELQEILELPFRPSDPRTKHSLFQSTLELEVAAAIPYSPGRMADKLRTLAQHLVSTGNTRAVKYLSRVARCFLLDMPEEFAVMARTVLDVSLQEILSDDGAVLKQVGGGPHVTLDTRLRYCESMGIFEGDVLRAARNVKRVGDDAAHGLIQSEPNLEALLAELDAAMNALVKVQPKAT